VVGEQATKPSPNFQIIWQGEAGSFVEYSEKVSKRSIAVTLHARNFNVKTREGLQLAKAALDQATQQVSLTLQRLPQCAGKRVTENRREDHVSRNVLTRTVDFMIGDEKAIAAAEAAERKRRDEAEQAERQRREEAEEKERKQARERDERERKHKEREERDNEEKKERDKKEREKKVDPAVRPLQVRIANAGPGGDPAGEGLNRCLQTVKASATDRSLSVTWDMDSRSWPAEAGARRLSVTLLDRNGHSLAQFTSADFTADKQALRVGSQAAAMPAGAKPAVLKAAGNTITYEVDRRLLQETVMVEVGFAAP
jgi:hypothetical protein